MIQLMVQYLATNFNVANMLQTSHFWVRFLKNQNFWNFEEICNSFKKKVNVNNFEKISNAQQKHSKILAKFHENTKFKENSRFKKHIFNFWKFVGFREISENSENVASETLFSGANILSNICRIQMESRWLERLIS